jgi:hypothetical protein
MLKSCVLAVLCKPEITMEEAALEFGLLISVESQRYTDQMLALNYQ